MRDEVAGETVRALLRQPLESCRRDGLGRHLEGQLRDHHRPQRSPRHVDAFPETIRSQEDCRTRLPESPQ